MITETLFVKFQQPVPMPVFFAAEFLEFLRLLRIILAQSVRKVFVDAGVFFFERNGERENFLFGETVEGAHSFGCFLVFGTDETNGRKVMAATHEGCSGVGKLSSAHSLESRCESRADEVGD